MLLHFGFRQRGIRDFEADNTDHTSSQYSTVPIVAPSTRAYPNYHSNQTSSQGNLIQTTTQQRPLIQTTTQQRPRRDYPGVQNYPGNRFHGNSASTYRFPGNSDSAPGRQNLTYPNQMPQNVSGGYYDQSYNQVGPGDWNQNVNAGNSYAGFQPNPQHFQSGMPNQQTNFPNNVFNDVDFRNNGGYM